MTFTKEYQPLKVRLGMIWRGIANFFWYLVNPRIDCYLHEEKRWVVEPFSFMENLETSWSGIDSGIRGYLYKLEDRNDL